MQLFPVTQKDLYFINFDKLILPKTPNYALVQYPLEKVQPRQLKSPVCKISIMDLKHKTEEILLQYPRIKKVQEDVAKNQQIYVRRTRIMKFPDIINIQFIKIDDTHSTFSMLSRAKYGYSDLNVNPTFVASFIRDLTQALLNQ
ncbi:MAG: DUF1499 domain-containing protein [Pseudomonadota bacterium]